MNSEIKKMIDFLLEIEKLKLVKRRIPVSDGVTRETAPEHVWHMCMYVLLLEKKFCLKIDLLKTLKIFLIHDLVEIYAGDTPFWDEKANIGKKGREEQATKKLFNKLPDDFREEFTDLWREFEECRTNEAKIAKSLDELQAIGQHLSSNGIAWKEMGITSEMFKEKTYPRIEDDFLKELWNEFFKIANKRNLFASAE